MASAISHAVAAVALGSVLLPRDESRRVWLLGAACAVVPDADVIGFRCGVAYGDLLGHRGLTHSLAFAAALSAFILATAVRAPAWPRRARVLLYLFVATASHGMLDALTNGGLGVAFFAPFDRTRYFFPFRPIAVSPLSVRAFFSTWGAAVLWSELRWIWIPSVLLVALAALVRRRRAGTLPIH